jgi:hypothetical protein
VEQAKAKFKNKAKELKGEMNKGYDHNTLTKQAIKL